MFPIPVFANILGFFLRYIYLGKFLYLYQKNIYTCQVYSVAWFIPSKNIIGQTFGNYIFVSRNLQPPRLTFVLKHESQHVTQYHMGWFGLKFIFLYMFQLIKYGYEKAPFEVEARKAEKAF